MGIISTAQLTAELPADANSTAIDRAILRATDLLNAWAVKYETFPDATDTQPAPYQVQLLCLEMAKSIYWQSVGQLYRDGQEQDSWQAILNRYEKTLADIEIPPTGYSRTIALNSDGVMLIDRNVNILPRHQKLCYVVSATSPSGVIHNQDYHWVIRRGHGGDEDEFSDGWYFDADGYEDQVEGTLYYARSWRNDGMDYQSVRRWP